MKILLVPLPLASFSCLANVAPSSDHLHKPTNQATMQNALYMQAYVPIMGKGQSCQARIWEGCTPRPPCPSARLRGTNLLLNNPPPFRRGCSLSSIRCFSLLGCFRFSSVTWLGCSDFE